VNYAQFADDEAYLFDVVSQRFSDQGWLGAFDVMSIARWKAERARSHFARRVVVKSGQSLEAGSRMLTRAIAAASDNAERFRVVCGIWGFPLPTGTALLTVCFPTDFTVYDVRVCTELDAFQHLAAKTRVESRWTGYQEFVVAVRQAAPPGLTLRECDRWLWGRSRHRDLQKLVREIGDGSALRGRRS